MRPMPPKPGTGITTTRPSKTPKPGRIKKTFVTQQWDTAKQGERIIVFADSGMGKTTLEALLPNPKFGNFNGGSDKIKHPVTGERLVRIPRLETFDDVRDVCYQPDLFNPGDSFVLDTGTEFEGRTVLPWMIENIPTVKGDAVPIKRIESYGYGRGYRHLYDTMRLPLLPFDVLIERGVNVVISCQMQQVELANSSGADFLCDVPKLQKAHGKSTPSVWGLWNEWADHIFKIDYADVNVTEGKSFGTADRVIRVHGQPSFKAKSRSIPHLFPIVSFSEPSDDSIWRFLFDEAWRETDEWKTYIKEIGGEENGA